MHEAQGAEFMNKIPQIEPLLGPEETAAVLAVLESGFLTEGKKTREFERELGKFFGVPHAIVVNNATLALTIALQALGIGPGDEVIVPDFTFVATANAVALAGARPVFADVSRETFTLDLADAEARITERTAAIVPVHLNGRSPDMAALAALARKYDLAMVEDAAQAMGSRRGGCFLGTCGDAGVFSLGTTKIITAGQGGVILTRRDDVGRASARIKDHGRLSRSAEVHDTPGFNSKFTDLQAAVGLEQFRKLPQRMAQKRALFRAYRERLDGVAGLAVPPMDLGNAVPWFVDLLCADRDGLKEHLAAQGIETRPFYFPVHSQPCFGAAGSYPATEEISARGLWLPSSLHLAESDVDRICALIREHSESAGKSLSLARASAER
jgi:perosamine synthetase